MSCWEGGPIRVGFYGKLPSRGDFVRAGLSRAIVEAWDGWLQAVMPAIPSDPGDIWWAMRAWRFAFDPGVCGPCPATGLFLPSADRVGRLFPLLIAAEAAGISSPFLDGAESVGTAAITSASPPETLAHRLHQVPRPSPGTPAAGTRQARWWRQAGVGEIEAVWGDALPDANTFLQMVTA